MAALPGCLGALVPKPTVPEMMTPGAQAQAARAMQIRQILAPQQTLQNAALSVVQDLGYQVKFTSAQLGLIIASHPRNDILQQVGPNMAQFLEWEFTLGIIPPPHQGPFSTNRVVIVIQPVPAQRGGGCTVRVQFFRAASKPQEQKITWA